MTVSRPRDPNHWLWMKLAIIAVSVVVSGWRLLGPAGPGDAPDGGELTVDLLPDSPFDSDE